MTATTTADYTTFVPAEAGECARCKNVEAIVTSERLVILDSLCIDCWAKVDGNRTVTTADEMALAAWMTENY